MIINTLISIGLYTSGIVVFAVYKYHGVENIINTDLRREFDDLVLPENVWPIIVMIMNVIYVIACCIWPFWVIGGLWKYIKSTLKKS